ncbi:hypothetical protein [Paracoccus chinensis]|uniref:Uncharacterized protein n=1 Tax=Paracoccus chinensis TaxID=525640 RepID=A0A1G9LWS9_9RHOB|nr:hypothetical protein [Paracoccus chinensis]SDL66264.1 hypothetical protein SAMN04487971_1173 [Paracoccus chinensis]
MSWTVDDYLDVEENDLEWFESNPDRILRRRTAFPFEVEALDESASQWGVERSICESSETLWALVLREAPITRLYYTDPEDFYDYGEPAVNDDFTLMMMWDKIMKKPNKTTSLIKVNNAGRISISGTLIDLHYLQGFKAAMIAYRKHQRKTLTLQ